MSAIFHLATKEFRLLFRDKVGLFWAFCFPVMMALFFGTIYGGSGQGSRGIKVAVVDEDQSEGSTEFVQSLTKSASLRTEILELDQAVAKVRKGELAAYIHIKKGYGANGAFFGGGGSNLEIGIDPSRKAEEGYLQGILMQTSFQSMTDRFSDPEKMRQQVDRALDSIKKSTTLSEKQKTTLSDLMTNLNQWSRDAREPAASGTREKLDMSMMKLDVKSIAKEDSGPRSSYDVTFPQGVMWGILGTITSFAIGLAIERNNGTLLRLRLAPLSYAQILAGKALACFLTCMLIVTVILMFGKLVFGVRIDQPLYLALAIASCGVCYTGIMMFLSTLGKTERAVNGVGWGILMPLTLVGGGSIPVFFMPDWLQRVSNFSPIKWSILGMEGGIWRGFSLEEMLVPCGIQVAIGIVCFAVGVMSMRKLEG